MKNEHYEKYRRYWELVNQFAKEWIESGYDRSMIPYNRLPEEFRNMTCGAKTRAGTPCKLTSLYKNGRCKFHGGLSTGPKTTAGKKRAAKNGLGKHRKKSNPMDP